MPPSRFIEIDEARQNNLKGVTVRIPIGGVTAVTHGAGVAFELGSHLIAPPP